MAETEQNPQRENRDEELSIEQIVYDKNLMAEDERATQENFRRNVQIGLPGFFEEHCALLDRVYNANYAKYRWAKTLIEYEKEHPNSPQVPKDISAQLKDAELGMLRFRFRKELLNKLKKEYDAQNR